jgi:dihydroxy-acid dehydratase
MSNNKYSQVITQSETLPAARAMLHAVGFSKEDLKKAQVGIVSTGFEGNPCNMHLNQLALGVKEATEMASLKGLIFHTIGVSDGISMGTSGMRYSLPSRDIIADSIETVVQAQHYDGLITVVGCDKNMPGAMMAICRLNRPSILLYGGTIASGNYKDKKLDIVSAFEALGEKMSGKIDQHDYDQIIEQACPGKGACGGMYTANTMASAIEAMGMSLPYSSSHPAASAEKVEDCRLAGEYMAHLLEQNILPLDIITKKALENAFTLITAMGGSTNAVLHLLAIAHAANIQFSLEDMQRISMQTPLLADLKPSGRYLMEDLHAIGGIPAVLKLLWKSGKIHGDCMTVTGKTMAENLSEATDLPMNQDIIYPMNQPILPHGHIRILYGNLASEGAVAKITGKEGEKFVGKAIVFEGEFEANQGIIDGLVKEGMVVVIRYEGPKGGPGMPEMLKPTSLIMGAGLGKDVALITDGRFSGGTHGFVVGHITPEAYEGGVLALVQSGDIITIDAIQKTIDLQITEEELAGRRAVWQKPKPKHEKGMLKKYIQMVSNASKGCITDG